PATLPAGLPQPATGHRLAVAGGAGQQHPAARPAAVGLDAVEIGRFEIADGVLPELVELLGRQDGGVAGGFVVAAAAQGDLVESTVVLAVDGDKVEAPDVALVAVAAANTDEADALDVIQAHAELEAGSDSAVVGVPVADQDAVDG